MKRYLVIALVLAAIAAPVTLRAEEDAHAKKIIEMVKDGSVGRYDGADGLLRTPVVKDGSLTLTNSELVLGAGSSVTGDASISDDLTLSGSLTVIGSSVTNRWDDASGAIDGAVLAAATVLPAAVAEGIVVSPTGYSGTGVKVQLGSVTNTQVVVFADAFTAAPAVVLGPEAATTNIWFVSGLSTTGFTASTEDGVAGGYIAVGLK